MKIAHLISSRGVFGAENVVLSLAQNFNKGNNIAYVGMIRDMRFPDDIELISKAKTLCLPTFIIDSNGRFDFKAIIQLKRFLIKNKIDILHTHNYKSNIIGLAAVKMAAIPIVSTVHGYTDLNAAVSLYERIDRFILSFLFDKIVVVNDKILPHISQEKRFVIRNGLNINLFCRDNRKAVKFRKEFNISNSNIVIATAARLSKEKNQAMLIDAAEILFKKNHNITIIIAGDGPERKYLNQQIKEKGIYGQLIFTGFIKDMSAFYSAVDIFVLTSHNEGIPLVILEAQASKVAVVATNVGGVADIIIDNETGLLVEPGDVQQFTKSIEMLINIPEKRNMIAESAFQSIRKNFSIDKMIQSYHDLYSSCISRRI